MWGHVLSWGVLSVLSSTLAPVGGGNSLTLPAQRHLVRMNLSGQPTWFLALQQEGSDGHGLGFFRSDDDGSSYRFYAPIQNDASETDTADLLLVGPDLALVYSYEGPVLAGSSRHDVYFQWWRASGVDLVPDPAVLIFKSPSNSSAYSRAELAVDSVGRIWVQAFRLEGDGSSTLVISVSVDGGRTFTQQPDLDNVPHRGGGRLISLGTRLMVVYGMHDGFLPARFILRDDSAPVGSWGPVQQAFSEGIYHGAALSAVATPSGGLHLVYKNENNEMLYYRFFDGSQFGPATQVDTSSDWALQPAITEVGDALAVFYNHRFTATSYQMDVRWLIGGTLTPPASLTGAGDFKGYPGAAEVLPSSIGTVPAFFSETPTAADNGNENWVTSDNPSPGPPPDAGSRDAGPPPDAGTSDAGIAPDAGALLFSDDFTQAIPPDNGLGSAWNVVSGLWYSNGQATSDLDGANVVAEPVAARDVQTQAAVTVFSATGGVFARAQSNADRYDLVLLSNGHVQIRRVRSGVATVLADGASGAGSLDQPVTLTLTASGAGPVLLTGAVDGQVKVTVTDSGGAAIVAPGTAGLWTVNAGVAFGHFRLWAAGAGTPPPDGGVDAGSRDAGSPDAGQPDAGRVDGGTRDAGPDGGAVDAGARDAGPADAGGDAGTSLGVLLKDGFSTKFAPDNGLGPSWLIVSGLWYSNGSAISDLDGADQAMEQVASCQDCSVQAQVISYGAPEAGIFARASASAPQTHYDFVLLGDGSVAIRRVLVGSATVLGQVSSGLSDLGSPATLTLTVTGSGPVVLTGAVNGRVVLNAQDSSGAAILGAGYAGLWTGSAGVDFDNFELDGLRAGQPLDAGTTDAGSADAGTGGARPFTLTVTHTDTGHVVLAMDPSGTLYGTDPNAGGATLWASPDGRAWAARGSHPAGDFFVMTSLSDGSLLADVSLSSGHRGIARSADHGATWQDVLDLGQYQTLSAHSFAELDGTAYFIEYQVFSENNAPINLWASSDQGRTWSIRTTFQGHRHGHGMRADPARHALWVYFGDQDPQCGVYLSLDAGGSWTKLLGNQPGDVIDSTVLPDGSILFGQDISFLPPTPHVARLLPTGGYTEVLALAGPSYSIHAVSSGGFVVGAARENGGDIYPAGEVSAHVYTSADGVSWSQALVYPWASSNDTVRADVYWELPSGELVLQLYNAQGFGSNGTGYQLLQVLRN